MTHDYEWWIGDVERPAEEPDEPTPGPDDLVPVWDDPAETLRESAIHAGYPPYVPAWVTLDEETP